MAGREIHNFASVVSTINSQWSGFWLLELERKSEFDVEERYTDAMQCSADFYANNQMLTHSNFVTISSLVGAEMR